MKKILLILFLFYTNHLSAQHMFYGINAGYTDYIFNNPQFSAGTFCAGFCAQYIFKGDLLGVEGDALIYTESPWAADNANGSTYSVAPYVFVVLGRQLPYSLSIKAGALYSSDINSQFKPSNDIGPSVGLRTFYKFDPTFNLGIELTIFFGQKFYTFQNPGLINVSSTSQLLAVGLAVNMLFR